MMTMTTLAMMDIWMNDMLIVGGKRRKELAPLPG